MAKRAGLDDRRSVVQAINKAKDEMSDDPVRLKRRLKAILETEERLTEAENDHANLREKLRTARKKMDGIREELRRVTKIGPDPQTVMPFAEGTEGEAVTASTEGEAVAAPVAKKRSRPAKTEGGEKPKRVRNRKK